MNVKSLLKNASGFMAAVLFMACSGASIEGSWVEPAPGMEHMLQGIKIESGGKASSICRSQAP